MTEPLDRLRDMYFEKLEKMGIEYIDWEEEEQGHKIGRIKDFYADMTPKDMIAFVYEDINLGLNGEEEFLALKGLNAN